MCDDSCSSHSLYTFTAQTIDYQWLEREMDLGWRRVMPGEPFNDGVCLLPTEGDTIDCCSKCKSAVKDTDAITDAVRIGQDALEKAEVLQSSNPKKSIQLTTKLVPILTTAGLVPAAHLLLALSRLNASLLITHLP